MRYSRENGLDFTSPFFSVEKSERRFIRQNGCRPAKPCPRLFLAAESIFGQGNDPGDAHQTVALLGGELADLLAVSQGLARQNDFVDLDIAQLADADENSRMETAGRPSLIRRTRSNPERGFAFSGGFLDEAGESRKKVPCAASLAKRT